MENSAMAAMSLGDRIKYRREQLAMTQKQLAERTRMKQNIISRLEHGDTPNPGADVLKRLALALRCSIDWLVGLYDDEPASDLALASAASP
jgi:transcriptional regulator with XRE-family HTH domain